MKHILLSLIVVGFLFCSCQEEETREDLLTKAGKEIESKNYQLAEDYCNQILATSDTLSVDSLKSIYLTRQSARAGLGKWKLALQDCKKMVELGDTSNFTKRLLGQGHFFAGNNDEAIKIYQELVVDNFDVSASYCAIADAYSKKSNIDSAYLYYTASINEKPLKNAIAYNRRGRYYKRKKMYDKALIDFDSAVSQLAGSEHQCLSYTLRGEVYLELGKSDEALQDFSSSIELCQDSYSSYYHRGYIYSKKNRTEDAIKDYENAVKIDSTQTAAYWGLSEIYSPTKNRLKIIDAYSNILRIEPKNYEALESRGLAYGHLGKYQKSLEDFDKIIEAEDLSGAYKAPTYELRGITYLNLNKNEAACNDFYKAVSLGNQDAQRRIDLACK